MTGRFRSGKMSARMRLTAKTAVSARAITATTTVIGRRSAARINHMAQAPDLRMNEAQKRREAPLRHRLRQQRPPHVHARELILHLRLRQKTLRIGDLDDARETGLIPGACLRFGLLRGGDL